MAYEQTFTEYGFERVETDMAIINSIITNDLNADNFKELKAICNSVGDHKTMMRVILTALIEKIEYGRLMMLLENWTNIDEWIKLEEKRYLYPLYTIAPDLVSWDKIFAMDGTYVFYDAVKVLALPGIDGFIDRKIAVMKFYDTYDYGASFKDSTTETDAAIQNLVTQKECLKHYLKCLPVWQKNYEKFFITTEPVLQDPHADGATLWKSEPIASQRSNYKRPTIGEGSVVTREEFERRFYNDIAHGVLTESPNPELRKLGEKFPFDNVVFSGDAIRQALDKNYDKQRASDLDMFIIGSKPEERDAAFKKLLEWFTCKGKVFYGIKGGVVCIYIKDVPIQFQIINTNNSNAVDIINRFDLTHIQWFAKNTTKAAYARKITAADLTGYEADYYSYEGLHVFGTHAAFTSQITRVTQIANRSKVMTPRLIKALIRGFDIETNTEIKNNVIDITSLVERPKGSDIKTHLRNQAAPWYPLSSDAARFDGNEQDEIAHILRMIERETQASEVTDDPLVVDNKTMRNINFEVEYDSLNYTRFNSDTVVNNGRQRGKTEFTLRNKNGNMSVIGGVCSVIDVSNEEGNIDIRMKIIEQPFIGFIKDIIEGNVLRRFTQKSVTKNILSGADGDVIEMRFDKFKYERRMKSANQDTCARTNRGAQINIEEDLHPGDRISPMFQLLYSINENPQQGGARDDDQKGITVRLVPLKIIKIEEDIEDSVDETVVANNQELDDVSASNSVTETVYDDQDFE